MRKSTGTVLIAFLSVSILLNIVLGIIIIKDSKSIASYEGTWKCSSDPIYEITMYVDNHGTFYQAFSIDNKPYQVTKGHIEGNTLIYQGLRSIEEGDRYEYLSDIPDNMYEETNTFYLIERTSANTLTLRTSNGVGTIYDFVRVDE